MTDTRKKGSNFFSFQPVQPVKYNMSGILGPLTLNPSRRQEMPQDYGLWVVIYSRDKPSNLVWLSFNFSLSLSLNQEKFLCLIFKSLHLRYPFSFLGLLLNLQAFLHSSDTFSC